MLTQYEEVWVVPEDAFDHYGQRVTYKMVFGIHTAFPMERDTTEGLLHRIPGVVYARCGDNKYYIQVAVARMFDETRIAVLCRAALEINYRKAAKTRRPQPVVDANTTSLTLVAQMRAAYRMRELKPPLKGDTED